MFRHGFRLTFALPFMLLLSYAKAETVIDNIDFITDSRQFSDAIPRQHKHDPIVDAHLVLFHEMSIVMQPQLMPTLKIEPRLRETKSACTFARLKTPERERQFIFSWPTEFFLAHRLYQKASLGPVEPDLLNENGDISDLTSLFTHYPQRKLILLQGRSYGSFLDKQIEALPASVIYTRAGNDLYMEDIAMLEKERGDYILSLPYNVYKTSKDNPSDTFLNYGIAGNKVYNAGHIMCNDTPETRAFLQAVNAALTKVYRSVAFERAHTDYSNPAHHEAIYQVIDELKARAATVAESAHEDRQ